MSIYLFMFISLCLILILYFLYYIWRKIELNSQNYLTEKTTVCITGGCMGIGYEIIKLLLTKYKCCVINIDIREDKFIELEDEFKGKGGKLYNFKCDLTDKDELNQVTSKINLEFENIEFLINNAAIAFNKNFENLEENYFIKTLEVNLMAPVLMTKKFIQHSKGRKLHIVNMGSVMSHITSAKSTDYISSKWGIFAFHECLRYDYYYNRNLSFTIICPFAVNTGMFPGFKSPIPFVNILDASYVARKTIDSIILKDKVVFLPGYMEYICLTFKILPVFLRDLIYFKLSK